MSDTWKLCILSTLTLQLNIGFIKEWQYWCTVILQKLCFAFISKLWQHSWSHKHQNKKHARVVPGMWNVRRYHWWERYLLVVSQIKRAGNVIRHPTFLCRSLEFFHAKLINHVIVGLAFYAEPLSCWNRKGFSPKCCYVVRSVNCQNSFCML